MRLMSNLQGHKLNLFKNNTIKQLFILLKVQNIKPDTSALH